LRRGHLQGIRRQVHRVHGGIREGFRQQDGQAAGAGAQVQGREDALRLREPGLEVLQDHGRQEGAGHDHPLVHVKTITVQPGLAGEVGRRDPLPDASFQDGGQTPALLGQQAGVQEGIQPVQGQVQGMQDQVSRLVVGIAGAMAEEQAGLVEAGHGEA
jgi:hypothetical protein